jgi:hypothetical protein
MSRNLRFEGVLEGLLAAANGNEEERPGEPHLELRRPHRIDPTRGCLVAIAAAPSIGVEALKG